VSQILAVKIALYFNKGLTKEFHMTDMNQTDIEQTIRDQIAQHSVLLYMKGTPQFPQCGFSARAVDVLTQIGRPFAFVNILENPEIRATLPQIANWPTFPQLWVAGELIGGSDIIYQMFQDGELQPLIEANSPAV
jgi:monothiol glutaredoxin